MNSKIQTEHFVTYFDSSFLAMGMALHESLMAHGRPFRLWILCIDEQVERQLERIGLPNVILLSLKSVETPELLVVKPGRSLGEYCWTLTPFTFQAVFDRDGSVERVTYLDADLFFFDSPRILLNELDAAGKHVLITEHAYQPGFEKAMALNGRFCVQFLTFRRTAQAAKVMRWWQEKCLEWCFARFEEGRFGDQKYLDCWPELFADEIHIVRQTEKTLAPWNVRYIGKMRHGELAPVFFHFHGLRILGPATIRLYCGYKVGRVGLRLYDSYIAALLKSFTAMKEWGIAIPYLKESESPIIKTWHKVLGRYCLREYEF